MDLHDVKVAPKPYEAVHVLHIYFEGDDSGKSNLNVLSREWNALNYDVDTMNDQDMGLVNGETPTTSTVRVKDCFDHWWAAKEIQDQYVQGARLYIIVFAGHGSIERDGHLWVANDENGTRAFDLTEVRRTALELGAADVLLINECCDGGYEYWHLSNADYIPKGRAVELISAGYGDIAADGLPTDFTRRFALSLSYFGSPMSIWNRFLLIQGVDAYPDAPGGYWSKGWTDRIWLQRISP